MNIFPKIRPFGASTVLLEWSNEISQNTHFEVIKYQKWIEKHCKSVIIETVPAYCSLAVYLKSEIDVKRWISKLRAEYVSQKNYSNEVKRIYIPVCYETDFGIDLIEMSTKLNVSPQDIINKHTSRDYTVYFLGFLPGFPYLGGLDPALQMSRKASPRNRVEAGSVGIAGNQTGIYTVHSPGGWNIIGRSPLSFFDVNKQKPNLLEAGNCIRFFSVSKTEFDAIKTFVQDETYSLKTETFYV